MKLVNIIKGAVLFIACVMSGTAAKSHYMPFRMNRADIDAVVGSGQAYCTKGLESIPADITFGCADIKYKQGAVKFCECGDAFFMSLRPCNIEFNDNHHWEVAPFWGIFWNYLKQFGLPIWHVGDGGPANALALEELKKCGGRYVKTWNALHHQLGCGKQRLAPQKSAGSARINAYQGIVAFKDWGERVQDSKDFAEFKRTHPELIFVNAVAHGYLKRKDNTYRLFSDAGCTENLPFFRVYKSEYSEELVAQILNEFKSDVLVVKPTFGLCSNGVNVIRRDELKSLLQLILRDPGRIPKGEHRCLSYWRQAKPGSFIVSECLESQHIEVGGKPYDPTMRVMYIMHHDNGAVHVNVLGGFWKIPVKSLSDRGSLTEQRVTIAHSGDQYTGIMVDRADAKVMKQKMTEILTKAYQMMLLQGPIA